MATIAAEDIIPPVGDLMQEMAFSEDDLKANRNGEMGARQSERLRQLQLRAGAIGIVGFSVFSLLATILLFLGAMGQQVGMIFGGIFLTLLNALFIGIYGRQYMRLMSDIRNAKVEKIQGKLTRVVRGNARAHNFVLRVKDEDFAVNKEIFNLVRQDAKYRLYRAPKSRVLLAVEPIP